jgi:hypothetical protein
VASTPVECPSDRFREQPGMTTTSTASASRAFSAGVASSSAWHPSDEET